MTADEARPLPSKRQIDSWQERLRKSDQYLPFMIEKRGLTTKTLRRYLIGWDSARYCIPVFDGEGKLVNVRRYMPNARQAADKIYNLGGHGSPIRWYTEPDGFPKAKPVLVVEGELDALKAGQEFRKARIKVGVVSGTGGAGNPPPDLEPLRDRDVYIAYDCDTAGRKGAEKLANRLTGIAATARVVDLGLPEPGDDVTDWFVIYDKTARDLWSLCRVAEPWEPEDAAVAEADSEPGERRDPEDLLRKAVDVKCAEDGSRNKAGHWLACQPRDERYTEVEARPWMIQFQRDVEHHKPDPYIEREALATTLRSAYSTPPRDAIGKLGAGYGWDDTGNGERLVHRHGDDMRFIPAYGGWHVWDGRRWSRDETGRVDGWAKQTARAIRDEGSRLAKEDEEAGKLLSWARQSANRARLKAMLESAKSEPGMMVPASAFDRDPRLLVCRNSVLVLDDPRATFREHRRDDYARLITSVDYLTVAPVKRWTEFLAYAVPDDDVREYLQRLAGYSLQGGNPQRLLIFLRGPTSTGKTTFIETLAASLGEYAGTFDLSMFRAKQDESPRADVVDVLSKRLIFTSEAVHEWKLHADVIKRMTGDDTIKARPLYSNAYVEKVPDFTAWIATNGDPEIPGADRALWKRLVVVPFTRPATVEDKTLKRTLKAEEGVGVLAWAVEGWNRYRADGLDDPPAAVVEATMKQRESLSHVDRFLVDCCEQAVEYWTPTNTLWSAYSMWCETAGVHVRYRLDLGRFGHVMEDRGFEMQMRRVGDRSADKKVRGRSGVQVRKGWERVSR